MEEEQYKFHPGDEVRILENFADLRFHDDPSTNSEMEEVAGHVFEIKSCDDYNGIPCYRLVRNPWLWDERWLEVVNPVYEINENELENIFEV